MRKNLFLFVLFLLLPVLGCGLSGGEGDEPTAVAEAPAITEPAITPSNTPAPTAVDTPTSEPTATPTPEPTRTNTPPPTPTAVTVVKETLTPTRRPSLSGGAQSATPANTPLATAAPVSISLDPLELVQAGEEAARALDTIAISQETTLDMGLVQQITRQRCEVERSTGSSYCVTQNETIMSGVDPLVTRNEVLQVGDRTWMRQDSGAWEELPPEYLAETGFSQDGLDQLVLSVYMRNLELVGETTIDGTAVYEVVFDLDVPTYFAAIMTQEMADLFLGGADDMEGYGKIWLGQEDGLPRQLYFYMAVSFMGEQMVVQTQATYSRFNQSARIPSPPQ